MLHRNGAGKIFGDIGPSPAVSARPSALPHSQSESQYLPAAARTLARTWALSILSLALVCLLAAPFSSSAQQKTFTHEQLFEGAFPAIFTDLPNIEGWADDDHYIERRGQGGQTQRLLVNARTGATKPYMEKPGAETEGPSLPDIEGAKNLTYSPDGKYVAYTKDHNLYVTEIATGKETALTTDGSDRILNGYASWVYYEEILGRSSQYKAFWWSPDSRRIAFMRFDESQVPLFPIYVSQGRHGFLEIQRYPKAGDPNPEVKIGIISVNSTAGLEQSATGGQSITGKQSAKIRKPATAELSTTEPSADVKQPATVWADFDPKRDQYFGQPYWTPGNELWVQWMNRRQDSLVVYRIDAASGSRSDVYTETQSTWIQLDDLDRFTFLTDNKNFILKSDKDGWENLYLYDMSGKELNPITTGNFWGTEVLLVDAKKRQLYIRARKEHSARFDVYRVSFNGKNLTRLSWGDYTHDDVMISPGGRYFISTYSSLSTPPTMALTDSKGTLLRELGSSKGKEFADYALPETKMTTVLSSDGLYELPVTITYPLNFDPAKKYPVWISVYGGPNAGSVYDRWKPVGGITQLLAQEGVVQVQVDNRSSGHFGKNGMNHIFLQLGLFEIRDYMDCGRWLRAQPWADTTRIGITGGSFGGYLTCMALTYGAEVFTHGIANYSVTDWRLYDTHYTERFMTTPADNPAGYRNTSALTYAGQYRGLLRIVHGSTDDNVHMQNSLILADELENRNKHFELMIYPQQRHGFSGAKRIHHQTETYRFIYENLLGKELPAIFRP